jgi:hypothetical protein
MEPNAFSMVQMLGSLATFFLFGPKYILFFYAYKVEVP